MASNLDENIKVFLWILLEEAHEICKMILSGYNDSNPFFLCERQSFEYFGNVVRKTGSDSILSRGFNLLMSNLINYSLCEPLRIFWAESMKTVVVSSYYMKAYVAPLHN